MTGPMRLMLSPWVPTGSTSQVSDRATSRVSSGGAQPDCGPSGFVALLSSDLATLVQSTHLGGYDGTTRPVALSVGTSGVYVAGYTISSDFPGTTGGAQPTSGGNNDAFVALLGPLTCDPYPIYLPRRNWRRLRPCFCAEYQRGLRGGGHLFLRLPRHYWGCSANQRRWY